jgi:hypothetical protein
LGRQNKDIKLQQQINKFMSTVHLKSVLEQIAEQIFTMKDVKQAKNFITIFVSDKGINEKDKQNILNSVSKCKHLYLVQMYICNSLLKYEGLGMNNYNKTSKQAAIDSLQYV